MTRRFATLILAGVLACSSWAALAQNHDATPACDGPMHHGMEKMERMHARHMDELKSKLQLTPEQQNAWNTFAASVQPPKMQDHQRPDMAGMDALSTPERIEKMRTLRKQHMAEMESRMTAHEEAVKTFYATLNATQKKTFDEQFMHHGHHMMQGDQPAEDTGNSMSHGNHSMK